MDIFPNVGLSDLGIMFDENSSAYTILMNIVSPHPIVLATLPVIGPITVQMSIYAIFGILIAVAIARSTSIPTVVAGISAMLFVPFIVDTGYVFVREAESYHSTSLVLMIVAIIIGVIALAVITLLEGAAQSQDASDS
jgi:K+-sensing histidine kinase KdpD